MAINFAYNFAEVDIATGMCVGVVSSSNPNGGGTTSGGTMWVEIPVNDPEYLMKYYLNGNWYEDANGTIPWTSSLL